MSRTVLASLVLVALVAGCAPAAAPSVPSASPTAALVPARGEATPSATVAATPVPVAPTPAPPPPLPHVFVVVMENASLARALQSSPIGALASTYVLATNYHAVARPSLPNYLALTSGSTWGIVDDGYHSLPSGGIGSQLTAAGIAWRAYMEGLTEAGCMLSPYPYALKHNPFAYYGGACPANVVSLDALEADIASGTPNFVWITPGLCHDGHDCSLAESGAWLEGLVSRIVSSAAWNEQGVLFIVWDEGDGGDANVVPLIAATQGVSARRIATAYDHFSLLATIEDLFGLPRLGAAAQAQPLADLIPRH